MATLAASRNPVSDSLWQQAQAWLVHDRLDAARGALASLQSEAPDDVRTHLLAAQIAWREDRVRDGVRYALDAARVAPDDPEILCDIAAVLLETGETTVACECLARAAVGEDLDPRLLIRMAGLRKRLEQHADALALLDRAASLGHATPALRFWRGESLLFNGRLDEAEVELAASLAAAPARGRIAVPLARLRRQTPERNFLALFEAGARMAAPGSLDCAAFEFARYKTLEDLGRDDEAWQALAHGNAMMHDRLGGVALRHHAWLDRFMAAWTPERVQHAGEQLHGAMPVFIIGMPRSGTTLLERMLGNHARVAVAGELMDFGAQLHRLADTRNAQTDALLARLPGLDFGELGRSYLAQTQWRAGDRHFYIDKQPPNWVLAGAIHAALPQAPILNLVREPMDVCFSNWRAFFGDACAYSYDLDALAEYCNDYRRVMAHWHAVMPGAILDVAYADLVHDPEATLRRVFDFCGLAWQPDCIDITRNTAPSATLGAAQVRAPLHDRAFAEWQRYAAHLSGLRATVGDSLQAGMT